MSWSAERRLRLLAIMLARKRAESMGRETTSGINNETMLTVAVAPDEVLEVELGSKESQGVLAKLTEVALSDEDIWAGVVTDIKAMFRPEHWPAWLKP